MTPVTQEYFFLILSLIFIFNLVFSVLVNTILLKFSRNLGIRETSETVIRWASTSKPALGGITFFICFLVSLSFYSVFFSGHNIFNNHQALGVLGTVSLAFILGLADDAYNTKPLLKFSIQLVCSVILIFTENYITIFGEYEWLNYSLTFLWVVGIMNSINMLDNMDAITTTVSITIILSVLMSIRMSNEVSLFDTLVLIGVTGSLCGFLFHNWHPSKMYMGDTGSQFLGMFLAYFGIKYLWNSADFFEEQIASKQLCTVLVAFILPITDTSFVVISRLLRGQSPFVGGKDHTTHNLSYCGLSDSQVAFFFTGMGGFSVFLVILINRYIYSWSHIYTLIFFLYFAVLLTAAFLLKRHRKNE